MEYKNIIYDIETDSYSDDFDSGIKHCLTTADNLYKIFKNTKVITDYLTEAEKQYKDKVRYYTDLVMQVNHRANYYYEKDDKLCDLYCEWYDKLYDNGFKYFTNEDKNYYIGILD